MFRKLIVPFFKETLRLNHQPIVHMFFNLCVVFKSLPSQYFFQGFKQNIITGRVFMVSPMHFLQFIPSQNCTNPSESWMLCDDGINTPMIEFAGQIKLLGLRQCSVTKLCQLNQHFFCFNAFLL